MNSTDLAGSESINNTSYCRFFRKKNDDVTKNAALGNIACACSFFKRDVKMSSDMVAPMILKSKIVARNTKLIFYYLLMKCYIYFHKHPYLVKYLR